ncbi:MAG TPA: cation diffusion facilitator family transporter [Armatimonadota bacterium]|jgi:cobalt-zinc-cadmium efflux system protein
MALDHEHQHEHLDESVPLEAHDTAKQRRLLWGAGLTLLLMAVEIGGGLWTHSLALLSDAGHNFSDVGSMLLSFVALRLALRPPTDRHTYGLHRSEILAALLNTVVLLGLSAYILWEAWGRFQNPPTVDSGPMLGIAVLGLVVNFLVMFALRPHAHGDLNIRSAYLHIFGDVLTSVGVIAAAAFMLLAPYEWRFMADPVLSGVLALVIFFGALQIGYESLHILMEGVPRGMTLEEIAAAIISVPEVNSVHHLHAWSICSNIRAVSVHVVADYQNEGQRMRLRHEVEEVLLHRFGFTQTTIETECDEVCPVELMVAPFHHLDTPEEDLPGHHHGP